MNRRGFIKGLLAVTALAPVAKFLPLPELVTPPWNPGPVLYGDITAELVSITRKAFVPRLFVQLWQTSPLLAALAAEEGERAASAPQITYAEAA